MSWIDGPLVGFDTETTGVHTSQDRIITAAVVARSGGSTAEQTWMIDPGIPIPERSTQVHGITDLMVQLDGVQPEEALPEISSAVVEALSTGVPVVAFNAGFDLAILDAELARHHMPMLTQQLDGEVAPIIDPLTLDRALVKFRRGKRTLTDLCTAYRVDTGSMHTAEVDVAATLDLLAAIARKYPQLTEMSPLELHSWQRTKHREWAEEFNRWRASRGYSGPGADPSWP